MKRSRADLLIAEACAAAVAKGLPRPSKSALAEQTGLNRDTIRVRLPGLIADGLVPTRAGTCGMCGERTDALNDRNVVNDLGLCPKCADACVAPPLSPAKSKRATVEMTYAAFGRTQDGGKRFCPLCRKWSLVVLPGRIAMVFGCGSCGTQRMSQAKRDEWVEQLLWKKRLRCADVAWAPSGEGGFPPGVVARPD